MESYTFEKQEEYSLVEKGNYEVEIVDLEIKTYSTGSQGISIKFRIRDDVDQKFKNRIIFDNVWQEKDPNTNERLPFFNRKKLNKILSTQPLEDKTEFKSIEDIIAYLKGTKMLIGVGIQEDKTGMYEDKNVALWYGTTKCPDKVIGTQPNPSKKGVVDVADDDLPF